MDNGSGAGSGDSAPRETDGLHVPLPPKVRERNGAWHLITGRNTSRKLCRVEAGRVELYQRLWEATGGEAGTVWNAIMQYLRRGVKELAPATQKHYRNTGLRMLHHFGHLSLSEIQPKHCAQFLKACREADRAVTGNREKAFMSSVYEFALAEGWCDSNPWRGVRRNKEKPSTRYIEDWELQAAIDRAPEALQPLLAVAYLTGIRQTDLRLMKKDQIAGSVLLVTESKTGKKNEHEITRTVGLFLSRALSRATASDYVFVSSRGLPWSEWGLQSALRRFKPGFRFRDLRSKAQTDSSKDILGHVGQMRERYHKRRKLSAVK